MLCFNSNSAYKIYDLYNSRYRLYKLAIMNRYGYPMDMMVADVLVEASKSGLRYFNFPEIVKSSKRYVHLTDSIY